MIYRISKALEASVEYVIGGYGGGDEELEIVLIREFRELDAISQQKLIKIAKILRENDE